MAKNTHIQIRINSEFKDRLERKMIRDYTNYSEYITRLIVADLKNEEDLGMALDMMERLVREVIEDVCQAHGVKDPVEIRKMQQGAVDTIDYQNEKDMSVKEFKEHYRTWAEENTPWEPWELID